MTHAIPKTYLIFSSCLLIWWELFLRPTYIFSINYFFLLQPGFHASKSKVGVNDSHRPRFACVWRRSHSVITGCHSRSQQYTASAKEPVDDIYRKDKWVTVFHLFNGWMWYKIAATLPVWQSIAGHYWQRKRVKHPMMSVLFLQNIV